MSGDRGSRPRSTHRAASGGVVSLGLHRSPLATLCTVRIGRVARPALRECGRDEGARQSVRPVAPGRHVAAGWVGSTSSDQSDQSAPRPPAQEQRISTAPPCRCPPFSPTNYDGGGSPWGDEGAGGRRGGSGRGARTGRVAGCGRAGRATGAAGAGGTALLRGWAVNTISGTFAAFSVRPGRRTDNADASDGRGRVIPVCPSSSWQRPAPGSAPYDASFQWRGCSAA